MLTLYFSGTGNSKYIAEYFSQSMGSPCYCIEDDVDFTDLICENDTIAFCYPTYGSCVPRIMREFVTTYLSCLHGKKIILFCTQLLFSGDGARVFTDSLVGIEYTVIYAEHFNMPNNICNVALLPLASKKRLQKYLTRAERKVDKVCENIQKGIIVKRGFHTVSKYMGLYSQRYYFSDIENRAMKDVRITPDCIVCSKCVEICPMKNLVVVNGKIEQKGNCTLCYRCVNQCPKKAITVLVHSKVKKQYLGNDIRQK